MPMKMPKAASHALSLFEAIRPTSPAVSVRLVFGQPAAFVAGNMFLGVFGDAVFLRLSDEHRAEAAKVPGAHAFEPMPGRPVREYIVLPPALLSDPAVGQRWIDLSLEYAARLPRKGRPASKARGGTTAAAARRAPRTR